MQLPSLRHALTLLIGTTVALLHSPLAAEEPPKPNIIIILTDDQGYNDLGCFGSEKIKTPRIDKMAAEGLRLTSFYVAASLCGPSRAALMTGCYSQRLAERNNVKGLHTIIDRGEILIPELLKEAGYRTGAIGKWHIAGSHRAAVTDHKESKGAERLKKMTLVDASIMPAQKGFDEYFGIPYSNDMAPTVLMRDNEFVEDLGMGSRQKGITTRYTDEALKFIDNNKDRPFFLYLAHAMPHKPLWPGKEFEGKSAGGLYGDCIEEIDWNVGRVLDRLGELGIDKNTLVIFSSDNGPYSSEGKQFSKSRQIPRWTEGGSAAPLQGYKLSTFDGGLRVPCVMRFPARIKAGRVSDELLTTMDLLPTLARLAGAKVPADRKIDGLDLTDFLTGKTATSPREEFYYYKASHLHAVRDRDWKLVLPREAQPEELEWYTRGQIAIKETTLYDMNKDIAETTNVAAQHPKVVERLMKMVARAQADLGDGSREIESSGTRKATPAR